MKNLNKTTKTLLGIFIRYLIALILGLFINVFYIIFTPLTIYPVFYILKIFYPVVLSGVSLIIQTAKITLVPACIAGSAYYLLLVLNLLTPMNIKKHIKAIIFSLIILLMINTLRIILFSTLYLQNFAYFDITHWIFWYFLSILFVFLIWILEIKIYKIKEIPIYNDIKYISSLRKSKT